MTSATRDRNARPAGTPNRATNTRPERSSKRAARKTPLGWLPWLLLGLLALLLAATFLVINALDDDGPDGPAGDSLGQSGSGGSGLDGQDGDGQVAGTEGDSDTSATGSTGTTGTTGTTGSTGSTGSGAAAQPSLTAGGQDLLAAAGGSLAAVSGQAVSGDAVVESVVADEGFWVGQDASKRVFVFLSPEARRSAGESGFQVEQGQTVSLEGTVRRSDPSFADSTGVTADEGRQQLLDQGAYVDATQVDLAQ